jgi:2,3-bisphosphoglycerate-independent phosphoglycerate mutase
MKAILIIADGLGGRPSDDHGRTCLEVAKTKNLDELASRGITGLLDPIGPGVRPGSDTAHLSLLGYDPYQVYTGRGVFECLGIGMSVHPGDICFRANFSSVEQAHQGLRLTDRRAGRIESGQDKLASALTEGGFGRETGVEFEFRPSTQHRGALLLRGAGLSRHVTGNDPHEVGVEVPDSVPVENDDQAAKRTARLVNEFAHYSYEQLKEHSVNRQRIADGKPPANIILLRGASGLPQIQPIENIYGVRGAVISGAALYRGVALACGMVPVYAPGATGGIDTDLGSKAATCLEALKDYDYVFLHIKGTDNAGHDQAAEVKTSFIERIDDELIGPLAERIDWSSTHLAFTGDHTTPIDYGDHTTEPVPILLVGPNVRTDNTKVFGEREAGRGGLCRFSGRVLPILFGYNNWCPKFGS